MPNQKMISAFPLTNTNKALQSSKKPSQHRLVSAQPTKRLSRAKQASITELNPSCRSGKNSSSVLSPISGRDPKQP